MKESYEALSLEVIKFDAADAITTSDNRPPVEGDFIGEEYGLN